MGNSDYGGGNSNWSKPTSTAPIHSKKNFPKASTALVLGIFSLIFSTAFCFCCCGLGVLPGIILAIIGLVFAKKIKRNYKKNPNSYNEKSYKQAKTGRLLSLIGLIISIIFLALIIIYFGLVFTGLLPAEWHENYNENFDNFDFD